MCETSIGWLPLALTGNGTGDLLLFSSSSNQLSHVGQGLGVLNCAQWTWECQYLFKIPILILLGKYPEVGLLDHMVVLFSMFWGSSILFATAPTSFFHSHHQWTKVPISPHPHSTNGCFSLTLMFLSSFSLPSLLSKINMSFPPFFDNSVLTCVK